jgi:GNAT superfamily N-acetyltransferase
MDGVEIRTVPFDHPDAVTLDAEVQREYVRRYGPGAADGADSGGSGGDEGYEGDGTPLDPSMFEPPSGRYLIVYDERERPVATGGWRSRSTDDSGYTDGDAELKRMYVVPDVRGRGLARRVLAALEEDARAAGRSRMVLETGDQQPEAIALYLSSGYELSPVKFGHYREHEGSRCFVKPLHRPAPVR